MSLIRKISAFIASAMLITAAVSAVGIVSAESTPDASQVVSEMGAGWNLGNTLDATGGQGLSSETSWGNPKTTKKMIDAVKAEGFNTVRIPVSWGKHTSGSNFTIDSAWLNRVQEVVDYCIDDDMYVILNIHHDTDKKYYYPSSTYKDQSLRYIKSIWKQVSEKFKNYDYHLVFEIMNEPRLTGTNDEWWFPVNNPNSAVKDSINIINQLNQAAVDTIRAAGGSNKTRSIMIPGYCASIDGCTTPTFKLPTDSAKNRLIVSVHAYTPYNFCLNGSGTSVFGDSLKSEVDYLFDTLNSKYISKGIPVVIGETSASNKGNKAERLKWADYFCGSASKLGIPCVLWDNNAYQNSDKGEAHGHLDRTNLSWYDKSFVDRIVSYYPIVSNDVSRATISAISDKAYTGSAVKPSVTVKIGGKTLKSGTDYSVSYKSNTNIGTASVTITGKGDYTGSKTVNFNIVPVQVKGFKLVSRTSTSLKLEWSKASSINGYRIQLYKSGKWTTVATVKSPNTVTCTVSGLPSGTANKVRIQSYKTVNGKNYYGIEKSGTCYTDPSAVTGFKLVQRSADSLKLGWNKNSGASGYLLEQYKGGKWVQAANINKNSTTSYTIKGLSASTKYQVRITAYKNVGDKTLKSSAKSGSCYTAPKAVTGFKLVTRGAYSLKLGWNKNTSGDGYILEQYKNGKWVQVAKINKNTTSYTVKELTPATANKFRIKAYKNIGDKIIYSAEKSGSCNTAPPQVSGFKASSSSAGAAKLSWSKNAYADGYRIEYYSGGNWKKLSDFSASKLSASYGGMTRGSNYKFRISAYAKIGSGYYFSSPVELTVKIK